MQVLACSELTSTAKSLSKYPTTTAQVSTIWPSYRPMARSSLPSTHSTRTNSSQAIWDAHKIYTRQLLYLSCMILPIIASQSTVSSASSGPFLYPSYTSLTFTNSTFPPSCSNANAPPPTSNSTTSHSSTWSSPPSFLPSFIHSSLNTSYKCHHVLVCKI